MKKLFGRNLVKIFSLLTLTILITVNNYSFPAFSDLPSGEIAQEEVRFATFGDMGTGDKEQYAVAEQMLNIQEKSRFDLLLFLGDNIYESGSPDDFEKKFLKMELNYELFWEITTSAINGEFFCKK